jgi:hypothetical protein
VENRNLDAQVRSVMRRVIHVQKPVLVSDPSVFEIQKFDSEEEKAFRARYKIRRRKSKKRFRDDTEQSESIRTVGSGQTQKPGSHRSVS